MSNPEIYEYFDPETNVYVGGVELGQVLSQGSTPKHAKKAAISAARLLLDELERGLQ